MLKNSVIIIVTQCSILFLCSTSYIIVYCIACQSSTYNHNAQFLYHIPFNSSTTINYQDHGSSKITMTISDWKLVRQVSTGDDETIVLKLGINRIGRNKDCDIRTDSKYGSHQHCVITVTHKMVQLTDKVSFVLCFLYVLGKSVYQMKNQVLLNEILYKTPKYRQRHLACV